MAHSCLNNELVTSESEYWEVDGLGIPLCKVCPRCRATKLAGYRPEILRPYTQEDVDEPIEPDEWF